ncbi:hypothetical protein Tco_0868808 [Tanacetum coccineum]
MTKKKGSDSTKDYMQASTDEFMEFSSEVTQRLKECIKENESKPQKIKKITKYSEAKAMSKRPRSTRGNSSPIRVLLSHSSTPSTPTLSPDHNRYDPLHKGVKFRLGGVEREMHLLELGLRVGLYSERESRDVSTLSGLRNAETVNATHFIHLFWPTIGDGGYNVGNTKAKSIRNPRIKLAHRCITMTITGRKKPPIVSLKLTCSISIASLGKGLFITRSLGFLTNELVSVLNREPLLHVYRKTLLIKMRVIMELQEGKCCWPATREVAGEGGGNDEEGNGEGGNKGIGGSADIYRNMSQGEWQVHQA